MGGIDPDSEPESIPPFPKKAKGGNFGRKKGGGKKGKKAYSPPESPLPQDVFERIEKIFQKPKDFDIKVYIEISLQIIVHYSFFVHIFYRALKLYFQRLARLNELISNCKASQFDQETKLVSSFNNYLHEKQSAGESRKKVESWDRWMDQNGKPDLLSVQSVSAFISQAWFISH